MVSAGAAILSELLSTMLLGIVPLKADVRMVRMDFIRRPADFVK
jgi:hypothetical protein